MNKFVIFIIILAFFSIGCVGQDNVNRDSLEKEYKSISMSVFQDSVLHARYKYTNYDPPYPVYNERQIAGIAENMLIFQNADGGWPKNVDWYIKLDKNSLVMVKEEMIAKGEGSGKSTFDNWSTYSHVDYLAKVYARIPDVKYTAAVKKGINWMLSVQNKDSNGFSGIDIDAVTYNDDVMTGVLRTLKDITVNDTLYGFLDDELRKKASEAYDKGLECILKTQIKVNGKLTAWCQQHDHKTLGPVWAREYEPPSITPNESAGVVFLLMEIENPSPAVINSIVAACEWFDKVRVKGKMIIRKPAAPETLEGRYTDYERVMEDYQYASDSWCRFYDLKTEQPLLYDRGRKKVNHYNELSRERRNGYNYFGDWPAALVKNVFPQWKIKHGVK